MRRHPIVFVVLSLFLAAALPATAQDAVPLKEFAGRRARLLAQVDGPVVLFGYGGTSFGISGAERVHPETTFRQEENFYYLGGHREPDAALLLIPATKGAAGAEAQRREILFLLPRDKGRERWDGVRLGPGDSGIEERTGFNEVKPFAALRGELERVLERFPNLYALLPLEGTEGLPTHAGLWLDWLRKLAPTANIQDVRGTLGAMRQVKSAAERALLRAAIEHSMAAHRTAIRKMEPGRHEYEIAAAMEHTFKQAGCERPGYAPIVGSGFNSTVLHYNANQREMKAGEVVVIDVGAECAGYTADITRTLPTSGKFSRRQREIYEIVLGAQNAAIAAVKPGMTLGRTGENSLYRIAYDYINTHGKDAQGESLGQYFIHGLGHHIGLQVHDAGDPTRALQPGMILTIEPGIYIPEESLGVRLEDIVLVTEDGAELLTATLPRTVEEIEAAMAAAR